MGMGFGFCCCDEGGGETVTCNDCEDDEAPAEWDVTFQSGTWNPVSDPNTFCPTEDVPYRLVQKFTDHVESDCTWFYYFPIVQDSFGRYIFRWIELNTDTVLGFATTIAVGYGRFADGFATPDPDLDTAYDTMFLHASGPGPDNYSLWIEPRSQPYPCLSYENEPIAFSQDSQPSGETHFCRAATNHLDVLFSAVV